MSDGGPPTQDPEDEPTNDEDADQEQFADLPDGSGCIEIWEHLSEQRKRDDSTACVNE